MINSIKLNGFGIHKKLEVKFKPALNAIIGRNQRGKTNIMEAICYGLYGKTQNSTIDKIINFDMDKAVVELETSEFSVKRTRTMGQSRLESVEKLTLENKLNLDYPEFISIFYISSHETKSLFDASYFRNFLISLFGLDQYSKKYSILQAEYSGLQNAVRSFKKVNLSLLQARYKRVQGIVQKLNEQRTAQAANLGKYDIALNQLSQKSGEVRATWSNVIKKEKLLAQAKCIECGRPITEDFKHGIGQKIKDAKEKIQKVNGQIQERVGKITAVKKDLDTKVYNLDTKIERGRRILTILQEKAKQPNNQVNVPRIKELEALMPVFQPTGFPSYLLRIYVPVISETANNLLKMMFPDMSVSIRTEKPESGRPDFKIIVTKGEKVQEISDLCGVERVIVNLCFRLGIMVIFKQLSKTCIDFFMVDEGFEKVDDINALEVLRLFENFIKMGYLSQVILVTHKTILKQQKNINYIEL